MAKKDYPTPTVLRQLLDYQPGTGKFFWRKRPIELFSHLKNPAAYHSGWNTAFAGKEAFTAREKWGYHHGSIFSIPVKAHIVAFMMVHGRLPEGHVDHINGVRDDNRIENLREARHSQNIQNQKVRADSTSGYKGVSWIAAKGKFRAEISAEGVRQYLGYFGSAEDAALAYNRAAKQLHGEFAQLNLIP